MDNTCKYCNSLHKAITGQNYCSISGDSISEVSSNAYYFNSNNLYSGRHISRFTIRTISDGYQSHIINGQDYILDKNHYLLLNEGDAFESHVDTCHPVEGLLIAFKSTDLNGLHKYFYTPENSLLDDPEDAKSAEAKRLSHPVKYGMSESLKIQLHHLKEAIKTGHSDKLMFEESFYDILQKVYVDQDDLKKKVQSLKCSKSSTQKELYQRIELSKLYMESHLDTNMSLHKLSKIATLSVFHYLRSFKDLYRITPHQFLTKLRLEKAQFLIKDSQKEIQEIVKCVGFQNSSSFSRLFKKHFGLTPLNYRTQVSF